MFDNEERKSNTPTDIHERELNKHESIKEIVSLCPLEYGMCNYLCKVLSFYSSFVMIIQSNEARAGAEITNLESQSCSK